MADQPGKRERPSSIPPLPPEQAITRRERTRDPSLPPPQQPRAATSGLTSTGTPGAMVYPAPLPKNIDDRLVLWKEPDSQRSAAFRVLAHRLDAAEVPPRVILVTSPAIGDGKTTCAVNLTAALAERGGRRTVLMELAVRRPALARLLGYQPPLCVTEQIARHTVGALENWLLVEPAVPGGSGPKFHVAAAAPKATALAMDPMAVKAAAQSLLRAGYDQVVIDGSSLAEGADSVVLEEAADGVLLVARTGRTTVRQLRAAEELLDAERFLGVVLVDS